MKELRDATIWEDVKSSNVLFRVATQIWKKQGKGHWKQTLRPWWTNWLVGEGERSDFLGSEGDREKVRESLRWIDDSLLEFVYLSPGQVASLKLDALRKHIKKRSSRSREAKRTAAGTPEVNQTGDEDVSDAEYYSDADVPAAVHIRVSVHQK